MAPKDVIELLTDITGHKGTQYTQEDSGAVPSPTHKGEDASTQCFIIASNDIMIYVSLCKDVPVSYPLAHLCSTWPHPMILTLTHLHDSPIFLCAPPCIRLLLSRLPPLHFTKS